MASHALPPVACLTLLRISAGSAVLPPAGSAGAAFVAATPASATASAKVISLARFIGSPPWARTAPQNRGGRRPRRGAVTDNNTLNRALRLQPGCTALRGPKPVLWRGRYLLYIAPAWPPSSWETERATLRRVVGAVRHRRSLRRLRGADVVEVELLALQMDVEPVEDVLQALDAVPGAA